jgi:hypothetical protein
MLLARTYGPPCTIRTLFLITPVAVRFDSVESGHVKYVLVVHPGRIAVYCAGQTQMAPEHLRADPDGSRAADALDAEGAVLGDGSAVRAEKEAQGGRVGIRKPGGGDVGVVVV